jgi:hypothetical protein
MTLFLPQLSYLIIKISLSAMNTINCIVKYLEHDFPDEFFCWLGYIFIPFITATLHGYSTFIHGILLVPLYFWNLFWHPNGQSIIDMLQNPEGNGPLISYNEQHHHHCFRE